MISALLISLSILAGAIVLFVVIVATRPPDFRVVRSATMAAPASEVFAQVNNFHYWQAWSPWAHLDPAMKETYEGPPAGVGAVHTWSGNNKAGEGRTTITESRPHEMIRIRLEFVRPFKATNEVEFVFRPEGTYTAVTWSMSGRKNFMLKGFSLFVSMDRMLGSDFEKGLARMKSIVEGRQTTGVTGVDQIADPNALGATRRQ